MHRSYEISKSIRLLIFHLLYDFDLAGVAANIVAILQRYMPPTPVLLSVFIDTFISHDYPDPVGINIAFFVFPFFYNDQFPDLNGFFVFCLFLS
jgi:hypothetical protein